MSSEHPDVMRERAFDHARGAADTLAKINTADTAQAKHALGTIAGAQATLASFWLTAAMDAAPPQPIFVDADR